VASALAASFSVVVAAFAASRSHRSADAANRNLVLTNQAQSGATLSRCMDVYSKIEDDLLDAKITGQRYFERVWSLQFAQHHLFKLRLIPQEVYAKWLMARHRAYHAAPSKTILGVTQADGWAHAKAIIDDPEFVLFVEPWLFDAGISKEKVQGLAHTFLSRANPTA
jgi:hypothetical protein